MRCGDVRGAPVRSRRRGSSPRPDASRARSRSPTGPHPPPRRVPHADGTRRTAWTATASGSASGGHLVRDRWPGPRAAGPPPRPPVPPSRHPGRCRSGAGWRIRVDAPSPQAAHRPQAAADRRATVWPCTAPRVARPTISCPRTSGNRARGWVPSTMCRSVPHRPTRSTPMATASPVDSAGGRCPVELSRREEQHRPRHRRTRAPALMSRSTSSSDAMDVSPGVVIARRAVRGAVLQRLGGGLAGEQPVDEAGGE